MLPVWMYGLRRRFWFRVSMLLWPADRRLPRRVLWPLYKRAVYRHGYATGAYLQKVKADAAH